MTPSSTWLPRKWASEDLGESGMGAYHGKTGFDTFTHYKSIVDKKTWLDLPMRYQPYRQLHEKMGAVFLKIKDSPGKHMSGYGTAIS